MQPFRTSVPFRTSDPFPTSRRRRPQLIHHSCAVLLLCCLALCGSLGNAHATTRTVNTIADDQSDGCTISAGGCTLREAIGASVSNDTINFAASLNGGTITLNGTELAIDRNLAIIGPADGIIVSGNNASRVFNISAGTVRLSRLTIAGGFLQGTTGTNGYDPAVDGTAGGDAFGGGIRNAGTLILANCSLSGNRAAGGYGGNSCPCSFGNGGDAGTGAGGGIYNTGTLTMANCTFASDTATGGYGGSSSQDHGGSGGDAAAGALFNGGTATLNNCTFAQNMAIGGGPGGSHTVAGTPNPSGGSAYGGALYNAGTMALTNCTVSGGNTVVGGNGLQTDYNGDDGGDALGGGIFQQYGIGGISPLNTIVGGNGVTAGAPGSGRNGGVDGQPGVADGPDVAGVVNSQGHNLIGRIDGSSGWVAGDLLGGTTDATKLNPNLGPLQDNSGPTLTMALLSGSAAINAGSDAVLSAPYNFIRDQRSFPRKIGAHVDIGAFELDFAQSGATLLVTTTDEHNDGVCGSADCTLQEALDAANANVDASTIGFKPSLSGIIINSLPTGLAITNSVTISGPGARTLAISGNKAARVFAVTGGTVIISGLTIKNGLAQGVNETSGGAPAGDGSGGGIANASNLTLKNCTLSGNSVVGGAGIFGGGAVARGGAIYNSGTLALNNCTLNDNSASGGEGGFSRGTGGSGLGGGIFNNGTLALTNCTLSANSAAGGTGGSDFSGSNPGSGGNAEGGGIYSATAQGHTFLNCTLSSNAANGGRGGSGANFSQGAPGSGSGGGIFRDSGTARVDNSIIARNSATTSNFNVAGGLGSGSNNLISGDPKLNALANNGGPTNTRALQSTSPAINAGNDATAPQADQRGMLRNGLSDIGSFEFGPASGAKPDALIRTAAETVFIGNNIYNVDGTNQTKSTTVQPGSTAIYFIKVQNHGNVIDGLKVKGTAGGSGWQVQYFDVATGHNITADVIASSGWWIPDLKVGGSRVLRLKVTPDATVAGGSIKKVLVTAISLTDTTKKDAVKAMTTVASSAASG